MQINRLAFIMLGGAMVLLSSCGGGDPVADIQPAATEVASDATTAPDVATPDAGGDPTPSAVVPDETTTPQPPFAGEWPNRFCVDFVKVETTLNLRAAPTTDAEVLASIPRSSCDLVLGGLGLDNNFQEVIYTTADGATTGWVSNNFIVFQDPPDRIEAAVLLMVDAWQVGIDTDQYSYGLTELPTPLPGWPVFIDGPAGFGCVLEGDVTVVCAIALVEDDGTEVARLEVLGKQRGSNGNDGEPYFEADFPDGPTIIGFSILDT